MISQHFHKAFFFNSCLYTPLNTPYVSLDIWGKGPSRKRQRRVVQPPVIETLRKDLQNYWFTSAIIIASCVRSFHAHCCSVALLSPEHSSAQCASWIHAMFCSLSSFYLLFAKQRITLQYKTRATSRIRKNNNKKVPFKKKFKLFKGKEHNMLFIPCGKSCLIISSRSLKTKIMLPLTTQTINLALSTTWCWQFHWNPTSFTI